MNAWLQLAYMPTLCVHGPTPERQNCHNTLGLQHTRLSACTLREVSQVWRRRHMSLIGEFEMTIHNCTARLSKAIGEVGSSIGWIRVLTKAWGIIADMSTRPRRAAAPPKFLSCTSTSSQADAGSIPAWDLDRHGEQADLAACRDLRPFHSVNAPILR